MVVVNPKEARKHVVRTFHDYITGIFKEKITDEERVERIAFLVKNLCLHITGNSPVKYTFNSRAWSDATAVDTLINDAHDVHEYICEYDGRNLYKELRFAVCVLIIFTIQRIRMSSDQPGYHLECYFKGMILDTIGRLGTSKSPAIAYRVKAVLYDAVNMSFRNKLLTIGDYKANTVYEESTS